MENVFSNMSVVVVGVKYGHDIIIKAADNKYIDHHYKNIKIGSCYDLSMLEEMIKIQGQSY